jgi:oligoribonuclease (3'-5' exoribonuclease)
MSTYLAIDIETTGLNPTLHQIIEIGAVLNINGTPIMECPSFEMLVKHGTIVGSPKALKMNSALIERMANGEGTQVGDVGDRLYDWLHNLCRTYRINQFHLLGKNVGSFDRPFLEKLYDWPFDLFSYRYLEIGSMYATPEGMQGQAELSKQFKGIFPGGEHEALFDARVSLALARTKWGLML